MKHSPVDRLDILELLALADDAATRRDVAAYVACFTDDAVLDGGMGEHRGKAAMEGAVGPIWQAEGDRSVHLTTNAVIESDLSSEDRAVATFCDDHLGSGPCDRPQCLEHHPPSREKSERLASCTTNRPISARDVGVSHTTFWPFLPVKGAPESTGRAVATSGQRHRGRPSKGSTDPSEPPPENSSSQRSRHDHGGVTCHQKTLPRRR